MKGKLAFAICRITSCLISLMICISPVCLTLYWIGLARRTKMLITLKDNEKEVDKCNFPHYFFYLHHKLI